MKTLKMVVELTYDDNTMHDDIQESIDWFRNDILLQECEGDGLILHSNDLGDSIGEIKVLQIIDE